jgi:uncharacterized membrane protein
MNQPNKKNQRAWLTPVIILAVSLLAAVILYPFLPAQIPIHFNSDGSRNYADKQFVYLIALIPVVVYMSLKAKYGRR